MRTLSNYNSIIVGAGHNGLVCAAYLAKNGQSVLVLESSKSTGGLAAAREFHPGFHVPVAHTVNHFSQKIAKDLDLGSHGFKLSEEPQSLVGLDPEGNHVVLSNGGVSGVGKDDTDSFQEYSRSMRRFASALAPFWLKTMPRIGFSSLGDLVTFGKMGLRLRGLGQKDLREFLRITALPVRDLMDEHFDSDILKVALGWDGLIGSKLAPRSPNHPVLAMLYRMSGEQHGSTSGLISALHSAASAAGAEIRTGAAVTRILTESNEDGLAASGVLLASGETITADRVVSSADPQNTFFNLVGVENLEIGFTNRIRRLRCEGYVAKLHLALNGLPEFTGLEKPAGRLIVAPEMDTIEFAFDDAKYGECSKQPVMEVVIPSLNDTALAPAGQHVLSAHVMYVPYQLKGGWNDEARDSFCERVIDTLARYAPGIREQIIHRELLTPLDLENACNVTGGHWHHTEFALDQALMMRPTYEAAQYSTPLAGLYLCGAGCHPAGDLTGAPGHNAAREILG